MGCTRSVESVSLPESPSSRTGPTAPLKRQNPTTRMLVNTRLFLSVFFQSQRRGLVVGV